MTAGPSGTRAALAPAMGSRPQPVSVNGIAIPRAAIAREAQNHPASKPMEAWQAAARALAMRELLLQEARRLGLDPAPLEDEEGRRETDEEAVVRGLIEREVRTPLAEDADCRRYYEQNRRRFRSADLYEVRHILLPVAAGDVAARGEALERARAVIAQIESDPAVFEGLAVAVSACPSGRTGGSLGQIGPGQTVLEFEQALAKMPIGAVNPEPVVTRYGVHVVVLDRRIEGRDLPFALVRARIAEWLDEKVRRIAIQQYLAILAGRAEIIGVEFGASPSPLVQ
jgi:peptidyl-prolyl cis-trans isomerase C